jgi:hypothetical protein
MVQVFVGPGMVCLYELWILRIGDVDDAPAIVPQMSHIEVPTAVRLFDCHLEGPLPAVETAVSYRLNVVCLPSRRNGVCMAVRREASRCERKTS